MTSDFKKVQLGKTYINRYGYTASIVEYDESNPPYFFVDTNKFKYDEKGRCLGDDKYEHQRLIQVQNPYSSTNKNFTELWYAKKYRNRKGETIKIIKTDIKAGLGLFYGDNNEVYLSTGVCFSNSSEEEELVRDVSNIVEIPLAVLQKLEVELQFIHKHILDSNEKWVFSQNLLVAMRLVWGITVMELKDYKKSRFINFFKRKNSNKIVIKTK